MRPSLRELLRELPPDTPLRAGWVLERLDDPPAGSVPEVLSTVQAARWLGHSPKWWREAADAGQIEGAWQDEDGGPWTLPAESCRLYLRTLQHDGIQRRWLRGPTQPRKTAV